MVNRRIELLRQSLSLTETNGENVDLEIVLHGKQHCVKAPVMWFQTYQRRSYTTANSGAMLSCIWCNPQGHSGRRRDFLGYFCIVFLILFFCRNKAKEEATRTIWFDERSWGSSQSTVGFCAFVVCYNSCVLLFISSVSLKRANWVWIDSTVYVCVYLNLLTFMLLPVSQWLN